VARRRMLRALLVAAASLAYVSGGAVAALPDERGYELVSPAAKDGSDVMAVSSKTFAATGGGGVAFASLRGFGDVHGTSTDAQYLARRTGLVGTSGWATHGITPVVRAHNPAALATFNWSGFEAAFTPDLSRAVYRSWQPPSGIEPVNTGELLNLYVLDGLLTGLGRGELATDSAVAVPPLDPGLALLFMKPSFDGASADLSHVLFESGIGLTADADPTPNPFAQKLYEYSGGTVRHVGRIPNAPDVACDDDNGPACVAASSSQPGVSGITPFGENAYAAGMMSRDGSRVLFQAPSDLNGGTIYAREDGTRTLQLNVSQKTVRESPGTAQLWAASADGSRAFFATDEGLVDGDDGGDRDLYMYDASAPAGSRLTLVSRSQTGEGHSVSSVIGASDDGRYVYFICAGQLVAGESARPAAAGLYVWHDGQLAYVGEFAGGSGEKPNTPRADWFESHSLRTGRVGPDGRHLLFMTHNSAGFAGRGGFGGYDQDGGCTFDSASFCRELFVYSADTGRLACASCNPSGRTATADALTDSTDGGGAAWVTAHLSHALSDDGRRVFFSSAESLVPEDTNRALDAYEYDVPTGRVHLLSSGRDTAPSYFLDASANGDDVFFITRERLVGWDTDDSYDLYDARVHGGLPEPVVVPPACAGEACLPSAGGQPAAAGSASAQYQGRGDVAGKLRKRCPRGSIARRVRGRRACIRTKRHVRSKRHVRAERHGHRARVDARSERSGK
jgi:hypothetical protein